MLKQKIEDGWLDEDSELQKVFNEVDENGSGQLSRDEIAEMARRMGKEMTKRELDKVMRQMDYDGAMSNPRPRITLLRHVL